MNTISREEIRDIKDEWGDEDYVAYERPYITGRTGTAYMLRTAWTEVRRSAQQPSTRRYALGVALAVVVLSCTLGVARALSDS